MRRLSQAAEPEYVPRLEVFPFGAGWWGVRDLKRDFSINARNASEGMDAYFAIIEDEA